MIGFSIKKLTNIQTLNLGYYNSITDDGIKLLKSKGLIEGRKPNFYISAKLAEITGQKALYTKNKGLNKEVYKEFIIQHS